jgi:hypothetical protein
MGKKYNDARAYVLRKVFSLTIFFLIEILFTYGGSPLPHGFQSDAAEVWSAA